MIEPVEHPPCCCPHCGHCSRASRVSVLPQPVWISLPSYYPYYGYGIHSQGCDPPNYQWQGSYPPKLKP